MSDPRNTPTRSEIVERVSRPFAESEGNGRDARSPHAACRSFRWRWLAAAFSYPDAETWAWLTSPRTRELLAEVGVTTLDGLPPVGPNSASDHSAPAQRSRPVPIGIGTYVATLATAEPFESPFADTDQQDPAAQRVGLGEARPTEAYLRTFGHTVRGDCPPHEIEYGELRADKLYQPHRLADIAAFYAAFGLEVAPAAADRVDHLAMECEFYSVLCAKEAYAPDRAAPVRDAQKKFLREHLARWTPAFARRVERLADDPFYRAAAARLQAAVQTECARFGLEPGNDDLQLRPADDFADPCGSCGLAVAMPGALPQQE